MWTKKDVNNVMLNGCVRDYFLVNENNALLNGCFERLFHVNGNNTMLNDYILINRKILS
jgi:hypothetical protein